jgi:hypothetical protein
MGGQEKGSPEKKRKGPEKTGNRAEVRSHRQVLLARCWRQCACREDTSRSAQSGKQFSPASGEERSGRLFDNSISFGVEGFR